MKHDAFERKIPVKSPEENLQVLLETLRDINRMDTLYTIRTNIEAAIPVVLKISDSGDFSTIEAVIVYIENAKFSAANLGCNSLFSIVFAEWYAWEIISDVTTVELTRPLEAESPIGTIVPKKEAIEPNKDVWQLTEGKRVKLTVDLPDETMPLFAGDLGTVQIHSKIRIRGVTFDRYGSCSYSRNLDGNRVQVIDYCVLEGGAK